MNEIDLAAFRQVESNSYTMSYLMRKAEMLSEEMLKESLAGDELGKILANRLGIKSSFIDKMQIQLQKGGERALKSLCACGISLFKMPASPYLRTVVRNSSQNTKKSEESKLNLSVGSELEVAAMRKIKDFNERYLHLVNEAARSNGKSFGRILSGMDEDIVSRVGRLSPREIEEVSLLLYEGFTLRIKPVLLVNCLSQASEGKVVKGRIICGVARGRAA